MHSHLKTFLFAFGVCIVSSSLLTLAATGLKDYQLTNVALDKQKNILIAAGLIEETDRLSPPDMERRYRENIRMMRIDPEGNLVPDSEKSDRTLSVYVYGSKDAIKSYVIPVISGGLWGKIFGYIAILRDGATVSGFTVYKHNETPGLGGEIEKGWFQKNFKNKKIVDKKGKFVSVTIVKGKVEEKIAAANRPNFVDGISGATLTGKFLSQGLKTALAAYEPFAEKLRKGAEKK